MILTPKQVTAWRILEGLARRILFDGGSRSGKTDVTLAWILTNMQRHPGSRQLIARRHLDHALATVWRQSLQKMIRGDGRFLWLEQRHELHLPRHGSVVIIDGLDDADRADKVLGGEYLTIFLNEATQFTWDTVQTALTRLAQAGSTPRKLILDCNPKHQRHWLYKVGVLHQDPDTGNPLADADAWARLHWTPYDNPHLPADYLQTLEALTRVKRRRMLFGEWCDAEGAVYDNFDEDVHVWHGALPPGHERWQHIRGIDFGYTNPFACLWGLLDPDGRLWIVAEHYVTQQTVAVHAEAIKARHPGPFLWTVADHDAEDRATLHAAGIVTLPARKEVEVGIKAVTERLKVQGDGRPRLYVHESCSQTIAEFYDYAWAPPQDNRNAKEEPLKSRDHAMDTIRYMVMQLDCGAVHGAMTAADLPRQARQRDDDGDDQRVW